MLRKISLLLLISTALFLVSCIHVLEELSLNADGSGSYLMRYDLSTMLSDPSMRELLQSSMDEEEGSQMMSKLDKLDTTIAIYDLVDTQAENREFWKKVNVHMVMSSSSNTYKIDVLLNFTSLDDVAYMHNNLSSVAGEGESFAQISSLLPSTPSFSQKKKALVRTSTEIAESEDSEADLSMLEMFLSGAKHTSVYYLPGKVTKTRIPRATIEGNTVTVENALIDVLKGEAKLDGDIKYK